MTIDKGHEHRSAAAQHSNFPADVAPRALYSTHEYLPDPADHEPLWPLLSQDHVFGVDAHQVSTGFGQNDLPQHGRGSGSHYLRPQTPNFVASAHELPPLSSSPLLTPPPSTSTRYPPTPPTSAQGGNFDQFRAQDMFATTSVGQRAPPAIPDLIPRVTDWSATSFAGLLANDAYMPNQSPSMSPVPPHPIIALDYRSSQVPYSYGDAGSTYTNPAPAVPQQGYVAASGSFVDQPRYGCVNPQQNFNMNLGGALEPIPNIPGYNPLPAALPAETPNPSLLAPVPHAAAHSHASAEEKNRLLVELKNQGKSYKDIKASVGFTEAESTLRGRYRTLTKAKHQRVRKPEWQLADVSLHVRS